MEDNLIKPDVVLVTKNVMVPRTVPAPRNKFVLVGSAMKKKPKIVKTRKNRTAPTQNLHLSQDNDCEHECNKNASEKLYLNDRYNSSSNFDGESEENFVNPYNRKNEFADFHDFSNKANRMKGKKSSLNFKKKIPDVSCDSISLKSRSLILDHQDDIKENIAKDKLFLERSQNDERNSFASDEKELEILTNKIGHFSRESVTEIRRCISTEISLNHFNTVDSEGVEMFQPTKSKNDECAMKYSWQDLKNWIPPCEKKKLIENEKMSKKSTFDSPLDCDIKYSWQVIGTAVQTSDVLIENFPPKDEPVETQNYPCTIKYSWQIIGTGTQVSFRESAKDSSRYEKDYWDGKILKTMKRSLKDETRTKDERISDMGKCKIYYSENTQTVAEKGHQTDMTDCRVKYSWQNLTKAYLTDKRP